MGRAEFMGYNSKAEMVQALDNALARDLMHTSTGRDWEREQQRKPPQHCRARMVSARGKR